MNNFEITSPTIRSVEQESFARVQKRASVWNAKPFIRTNFFQVPVGLALPNVEIMNSAAGEWSMNWKFSVGCLLAGALHEVPLRRVVFQGQWWLSVAGYRCSSPMWHDAGPLRWHDTGPPRWHDTVPLRWHETGLSGVLMPVWFICSAFRFMCSAFRFVCADWRFVYDRMQIRVHVLMQLIHVTFTCLTACSAKVDEHLAAFHLIGDYYWLVGSAWRCLFRSWPDEMAQVWSIGGPKLPRELPTSSVGRMLPLSLKFLIDLFITRHLTYLNQSLYIIYII